MHGDREPSDDLMPDDAHEEDVDHPLRHSLAGVQLKYSVSATRLAVPVSGNGGWWIVKLPDRDLRSLPTNEYLTMRWLAAAGFPVPETHLLPARDVKGLPDGMVDAHDLVYVINRFDRVAGGKIHVEDFAQIADVDPRFKYSESGASYDTLAAAIRQLTGQVGYDEFVRRIVAMLLVGNTDAHLKNWAVTYPDGRTAELSPVYDFHSLTVYQRYRWAPLALSLAREASAPAIGLAHLRLMAESAGADPDGTVDLVRETVDRLRAAWSGELRQEASTRFDALAEHYTRRLDTLPLAREAG